MLSIAVVGGGRCNITNSFAQDYVKKNHQHPIQQTAHRAPGSRWWLHYENKLKCNFAKRSFSLSVGLTVMMSC